MKKGITKSFTIDVKVVWDCPHCGFSQETSFSGSPYTAIAEDETDESCSKCGEFVTLNFYENEGVEEEEDE